MGIYSVKSVEAAMREKGLPDDGKGPRWLVLGNEGVTVATTWTKVEAVSVMRAKEREAIVQAVAFKKSVVASTTAPFDSPEHAVVAICQYARGMHGVKGVEILKLALDYATVSGRTKLLEELERLTAQWSVE